MDGELKVERVKWYEDAVYIKMCRQAKEIQRAPVVGDYVSSEREAGLLWASEKRGNEIHYQVLRHGALYYRDSLVWLPDQASLQEMVPIKCRCGMEWLHQGSQIQHFGNWLINYEEELEMRCIEKNVVFVGITTWEQFWLAFVMHKKYGKVWDGEKWQSKK